jgi:hypothetical protein
VFALDALRNLYTQANLIERRDFAQRILANGYLPTIETTISQAVA